MRKTVMKNIVLKQSKMSIMINEMIIVGKIVLVVHLKTAMGKSRNPESFYLYVEHVNCSANATAIYDAHFNCIQKSGFFHEVPK
jgi:hypothetical protein